MGFEVIADEMGAVVYSNTDGQIRTDRLCHPQYPRIESFNREFALRVVEVAVEESRYPSPEEWSEAVDVVREEKS